MVKVAHFVTPKRLEQYKNWLPSLATFGAAAFFGMLYVTDWGIIAKYIPLYNRKYKEERSIMLQ